MERNRTARQNDTPQKLRYAVGPRVKEMAGVKNGLLQDCNGANSI